MALVLAILAFMIFDPPQLLDHLTNGHAVGLIVVGVAARFYDTAATLL